MSQSPTVRGSHADREGVVLGRLVRGLALTQTVRERGALTGIALLASVLRLYRLGEQGYPNLYYAATVRSMLTGWHNAYFASFDPAGFISVDKPPLGFWVQTVSAMVLGFHPISLLLPQALAGIAAIIVLYVLVARTFGGAAGLVAALVLAVTPVSVATDRNNTPDSVLVLLMLLAVWAAIQQVQTGRLRWALLCALLLGLAFNVKMAQAFLVMPALALYILASSREPWRRRILILGIAASVLFVISFAWAASVDATPAAQRPYVGSTTTDSEIQLALSYNGLERITGVNGSGNASSYPGGGPFRLLRYELRSQIGWLLPLGLVSAVVALLAFRQRSEAWRQAILLWGVWLLAGLVFISVAGYFHPYYLATIAPALAAVAGIGVIAMWRMQPRVYSWVFTVAVLVTALFQWFILHDYSRWSVRLLPLLVAVGVLSVAAQLTSQMAHGEATHRFGARVNGLMIAGLCIAPAVWAGIGPWQGSNPILPYAGPRPSTGEAAASALSSPQPNAQTLTLIGYLQRNRDHAHFLVGGLYADTVAPIIVDSGQPALALGGFLGRDPALTTQRLSAMIQRKQIRFFLLERTQKSKQTAAAHTGPPLLVEWIRRHCFQVDASDLPSLMDVYGAPNDLYRCGRQAASPGAGRTMRSALTGEQALIRSS